MVSRFRSSNDNKIYNRIKKIIHNPIKCSVVFSNDTFIETFTERKMEKVQKHENENSLLPESIEKWESRCLHRTAQWYSNHLKTDSNTPRIIVVRGNESNESISGFSGFEEYSIDKFVSNEVPELNLLLESLKEIQEDKKNIENNNNEDEYSEHISADTIEAGLKSGLLYSGMIQVNKYSLQEAFVRLTNNHQEDEIDDIFIPSVLLRNRAVHGDIVAVELLPESSWVSPSRSISSSKTSESEVVATTDDVDSTEIDLSKVKPTGRVVGIIQRNWRIYSGTLQISDSQQASSAGRRLLSIPMDIRIPKIRISSNKATDLVGKRLTIRIDDWPRTSQYPNGHYVSILGPIGDIDTETKVLMVENDISLERRFSSNCMIHLPTSVENWKITEEDINQRRDLRDRLIMSIDPPGCEDIDDALSIHYPTELFNNRKVIELGGNYTLYWYRI